MVIGKIKSQDNSDSDRKKPIDVLRLLRNTLIFSPLLLNAYSNFMDGELPNPMQNPIQTVETSTSPETDIQINDFFTKFSLYLLWTRRKKIGSPLHKVIGRPPSLKNLLD